MAVRFKNAESYVNGKMVRGDLFFDFVSSLPSSCSVDASSIAVFPGFADVHVHLREPGFSYKETIKQGSLASAAGGYTHVCSMPNLKPVPDSKENIKVQLDIIEKDAVIGVHPYGSITVGQLGNELADLEGLKNMGAIAFSDDGRGVQDEDMMYRAMTRARELGMMIVAHCEVNSELKGGYIHDGWYAKANGHRGINSASEWKQIERDIKLADKTGCSYHVCHISTKESVALIRDAKRSGVDITCETAPHYILLCDENMKEDARFKMNPPLRARDDMEAILEGVLDGTIDMIATDHAPHSKEEKTRGLEKSAMGVSGIECAFPVLYHNLVKKNILPLEKLVELMSINPKKRFGIKDEGGLCIYDLSEEYEICGESFISMGKYTPFEGARVTGRCLATRYNGNFVYVNPKLANMLANMPANMIEE